MHTCPDCVLYNVYCIMYNALGTLHGTHYTCITCTMYIVYCIMYNIHCIFYMHYICTLYSRVYQNLVISSENYRTFPKVGLHYKEKAYKFLARSDYSLRPNSCVLFEIFVAQRKISTAQ